MVALYESPEFTSLYSVLYCLLLILASLNFQLCLFNLERSPKSVWVFFYLYCGLEGNSLQAVSWGSHLVFIFLWISVLQYLLSSVCVWKPLFYIFWSGFLLIWEGKSGPCHSIMVASGSIWVRGKRYLITKGSERWVGNPSPYINKKWKILIILSLTSCSESQEHGLCNIT